MSLDPADVLADKLAAPDHTRLRTAVLSSFAGGKATITLTGGTVASVPYLASYTPTGGDRVLVLQTGDGRLLILGKPA